MLLVTVIGLHGRRSGHRRQFNRRLQSKSHDLARATYKQVLIEAKYLAMQDGTYRVGGALLCVSLGEVHQSSNGAFAYKLIAGVILPAVCSADHGRIHGRTPFSKSATIRSVILL